MHFRGLRESKEEPSFTEKKYMYSPIEFKNAAGKTYCTISFDSNVGCTIDTWDGSFGTQDNLKKVLSQLVEIVSTTPYKTILSDTRHLQGSFDSSVDWINQYYVGGCVKAGVKGNAIVVPQHVFSKLSMKDLSTEGQKVNKVGNYERRFFGEVAEAKKWLASLK